jgi:trk system potassium uptake protein TrkA
MKVIICGAGQVGFNIAKYLAVEGNDVVVIDQRPELIRKISDTLDVQAILGHASHPNVLEQAGAADADMIIAVTAVDEVNMVACQVADSLFNVPTKIARVRHQSYLQPMWANKLFSPEHLPIDVIISPEIAVAHAIMRRLQVPGAIDVIPLANDQVRLIGARCTEDTPLVNTPLRQLTVLFPDLNIVIIGIVRQDRAIVPTAEDQMLPGDEVYFVVDVKHVDRAMAAFGHEEEEARRIVIFGGGSIGLFLAQEIEANNPGLTVRLIEYDRERAEYVAKTLDRAVVLHGDALDSELLDEANVGAAETVVAVTNDDETNILASLLAKRYGAKRVMTLVNKTTYTPLMGTLGVDVVISPRGITVSNILQHVRRGRIHAVHSLHEGFGELIEADALETSPLVGKPLKEVKLPSGILLGAIVRDGQVISPRGNTVVKANDRVVLFATAEAVKKVEKMFSVRLEYF